MGVCNHVLKGNLKVTLIFLTYAVHKQAKVLGRGEYNPQACTYRNKLFYKVSGTALHCFLGSSINPRLTLSAKWLV